MALRTVKSHAMGHRVMEALKLHDCLKKIAGHTGITELYMIEL